MAFSLPIPLQTAFSIASACGLSGVHGRMGAYGGK